MSYFILSLVFFIVLFNIVSGKQWTFTVKSNPEELHRIRFAIKQQNLDKLEALFWDISNPLSEKYTNYLSISEITEIISPKESTIDSLQTFLYSKGAQKITLVHNKDFLYAEFTIADLENLFGVQMYVLQHVKTGRRTHRSKTAPKIPIEIQEHIDFITGIYDIGAMYHNSGEMEGRMGVENFQKEVASNAPSITAVLSRGGRTVEYIFTPKCSDSSVPTNPKSLCEKDPIVSFEGSLTPDFGDVVHFSVPVNCKENEDKIVCDVQTQVSYYVPYKDVKLRSNYKSGNSSEYGEWQFMVVSTPPLTVRSVKNHYEIDSDFQVTNKSNSQCVVEFEQQYYNTKDLLKFFDIMGIRKDTEVIEIGYNDQNNPGGEANLDIQWIMGIGEGSPTTFWSIYANSTIEIDDILEWALQMNNHSVVPLVNSLSYGMVERSVDKYLGDGYIKRSDVEFMKLALRGITVIIADGDTGAGDLGEPPMSYPTCNDRLNPDWPSQSPYITAVGSTFLTPFAEPICYLSKDQGGIDCSQNPLGEVSVSMDNGLFWTTGGGASDITKRPSYQEEFVQEYLSQGNGVLPPLSMFNSEGRAYPDFATVGHNLMVVLSEEIIPVDGTSASAPIAGGIISLLNEERSRVGMNSLGFLNPLIYLIAKETPEAFNDVVVGENKCGSAGFEPLCCPHGFKAVPGFDFVSGLGTPNFSVLREEVLKDRRRK